MMSEDIVEEITQEDLFTAGLIGGDGAKERREKLGKIIKNWLYQWKTTA